MRSRRRGVWVCLVWLLVPVLLVGCGRRGGHDPSSDPGARGSADRGSSARPSDGPGDAGDGPGPGDVPLPGIEIGGSGGGGSDGGGSDGGETGGGGDGAEQPPPEPGDATEAAFRAVVQGTCLPVHRDGAEWNVPVPPSAVSCRSERAGLFQVTRTAHGAVSCPSGTGRDTWSHRSAVSGETTTLCLNRVWVRNYCVLAEQSGDTVTSIGASTAAGCDDTRVPVPYNQVMVVDAVYRAPAGATADHCRTGSGDNRRYWSLIADDGATLVCFRARS
ncbi:hypothetical protein ACFTXJ_21085 [Streptomyces zhihengii]|uniref:hypothetical protein n=1 Tax=Streptomyces zhihengii TaxID=1818004 RepID=UPI00363BAA88